MMNEEERTEEMDIDDKWDAAEEAQVDKSPVDPSAMTDEVKVELNYAGPDPAVWGNDEDRPRGENDGPDPNGAPLGEVRYEDLSEKTMDELKSELPGIKVQNKAALIDELHALGKGTIAGPGPEWEKDDQGRYINR